MNFLSSLGGSTQVRGLGLSTLAVFRSIDRRNHPSATPTLPITLGAASLRWPILWIRYRRRSSLSLSLAVVKPNKAGEAQRRRAIVVTSVTKCNAASALELLSCKDTKITDTGLLLVLLKLRLTSPGNCPWKLSRSIVSWHVPGNVRGDCLDTVPEGHNRNLVIPHTGLSQSLLHLLFCL